MADQVKVGILGVMGRMGQAVLKAVEENDDASFVAGCDRPRHPDIGAPITGTSVNLSATIEDVFEAADVVIDFTPPGDTAAHAGLAARHKKALVVGTTGLSGGDESALMIAAGSTRIMQAGNYSQGVNLLMALVRDAASKLGPEWDIDILEMHHRDKVDAPSGTALMLGDAAAEGRGASLDDLRTPAREGLTGERVEGTIGFAALRGGSVIGEHDVIFASGSERITLSHKAENRSLFADGAVRAALWLHSQPNGRYNMRHVLGLN
ncbi:4-hydroxy-tetrahydrodipicolinate reductase [Kordiimonas sp.]|uniref:4-hydroxy-tetrahydrodipicolinate reductase n=1 Tax=Kordiimonas sp. TaxID=1970157 RepID=UPI003A957670